jgi:hypothetical protein
MQRAIIVKISGLSHVLGLDELNKLLEDGWRVVDQRPMGGAGGGGSFSADYAHSSLVIIEKNVTA